MEDKSSRQVLLFGSFTEDETRSFQQMLKNVPQKNEFQFGSLDFAALNSLRDVKVEFKCNGSHLPEADQSSNLFMVDKNTKPETGNNFVAISGNQRSTLTAEDKPSFCFPLNNGVGKQVIFETSSPCMSQGNSESGMPRPKDGFDDVIAAEKNSGSASENCMHTSQIFSPTVFASNENPPMDNAAPEAAVEMAPAKSLLPRGLVNPGNFCFLNATLQALLSCSPFVDLLQKLRNRDIPKVGYPTLQAFVEFIADFDVPSGLYSSKNEMPMEAGIPLSPIMFGPVLRNFTPDLPSTISGRPRQEDAQEFLSFVMDQMHDELLKLEGRHQSSNGNTLSFISSNEDDGWETVGPKNKSAITRTQSFMPSELSSIFGGQLISVVKARGEKKASATVQPFLLLHLDILAEAVHSIEDALHLFSAPEALEGYRIPGKAGVVNASKSVKIQSPSKILIMHLMRFSYGKNGSTKLHKPVCFPLELFLGRDLLASSSSEGRRYELVATITHHGRDPSKGHYTADARCSDGHWLRYDDSSVTAVNTKRVLHDQAYVLFYRQS